MHILKPDVKFIDSLENLCIVRGYFIPSRDRHLDKDSEQSEPKPVYN